MNRRLLSVLICFPLSAAIATAQLAITEAMSLSATTRGTQAVTGGPDFWELTNFGTNEINLTGYQFNDSTLGLLQASKDPFTNLVIHGGESILFFENTIGTSAEAFRVWWGLGSNVQVVPFPPGTGYGLSGDPPGDGLRLWGPAAVNDEDLVDSVDFGSATRGQSFTYDPITGEFGVLSSTNMSSVFKAYTADDFGSPGTTSGRVPIRFAKEPDSLTNNPGDSVTFAARHWGMPRPTFQWFHNGMPIPGARSPSLTINGVQANHAGPYTVQLSNAFEVITSATATLTLNTIPMAPRFLAAPRDLWIFVDQNAEFRPMATGLPQPTFEWRSNGIIVPGATAMTLTVPWPHSVGTNRYSIIARNSIGSATNEMQLVVTQRPKLRVTEIMPWEFSFTPRHEDWWELTNFDNYTVDLFGYRFDDYTDFLQMTKPLRESAWVNTNHIFIEPDESIVFVERMSADAFKSWWGRSKLPPKLQVITYTGGGLGFGTNKTDGLALWNMGATSDDDLVDPTYTRAEYSSDFTVQGTSLTTDLNSPLPEVCCLVPSEPDVNGAFIADEGGDVGSPGYIRNPEDPRLLDISMTENGCRLTWRSVLPGTYVIQYRQRLDAGGWQVLTNVPPAGSTTSYLDPTVSGIQQRFYRITMAP